MRLQPSNPPGLADRKAQRYAHDVRNLRAQGHTYETIRLALLDAGVSMSISTVIREATRLPTQRELDHAQAEQAALRGAPPPSAAPGEPTRASVGTLDDVANRTRPRVGWRSGLVGILRRLRGLHRAGSTS